MWILTKVMKTCEQGALTSDAWNCDHAAVTGTFTSWDKRVFVFYKESFQLPVCNLDVRK